MDVDGLVRRLNRLRESQGLPGNLTAGVSDPFYKGYSKPIPFAEDVPVLLLRDFSGKWNRQKRTLKKGHGAYLCFMGNPKLTCCYCSLIGSGENGLPVEGQDFEFV